eukprot:gnl/Carplike_NY0171/4337_a5886_296.p1 GENE.gnl/Carplike_NY0171/4337_a5886_296~~gnl/Carplike_NY0171/4337_a5886_296.p1  ORF type:complete len:317 (+),score=115.85 gnl/Carplike_NY0171/4337_a5886_296:112-951(+)
MRDLLLLRCGVTRDLLDSDPTTHTEGVRVHLPVAIFDHGRNGMGIASAKPETLSRSKESMLLVPSLGKDIEEASADNIHFPSHLPAVMFGSVHTVNSNHGVLVSLLPGVLGGVSMGKVGAGIRSVEEYIRRVSVARLGETLCVCVKRAVSRGKPGDSSPSKNNKVVVCSLLPKECVNILLWNHQQLQEHADKPNTLGKRRSALENSSSATEATLASIAAISDLLKSQQASLSSSGQEGELVYTQLTDMISDLESRKNRELKREEREQKKKEKKDKKMKK